MTDEVTILEGSDGRRETVRTSEVATWPIVHEDEHGAEYVPLGDGTFALLCEGCTVEPSSGTYPIARADAPTAKSELSLCTSCAEEHAAEGWIGTVPTETVQVTSPMGSGYVAMSDAAATIADRTGIRAEDVAAALRRGDILAVAGSEYALVVDAPTVSLVLPPRFVEDHVSRDLLRPSAVVKVTKSTLTVELNREELVELVSDADHYATMEGDAFIRGLASSARALLARLAKHAATVPMVAEVLHEQNEKNERNAATRPSL